MTIPVRELLNRRGKWMQTYSGLAFWPLDPWGEEILIEDIAHSLSQQCRFAGHTRQFYSVAQHSVLVARACPPEHAAWGLMHDASEAYLVDLPRPIKDGSLLGDEYKAVEAQLMCSICDRFGLSRAEPACVKEIDNAVLMAEARDLLGVPPMAWDNKVEPLAMPIRPWAPEQAECEFLMLALRFQKEGRIL